MQQNRFAKYAGDPLVRPADPLKPGQIAGQGLTNARNSAELPYVVPKAQNDVRGGVLNNTRTAQDIALKPATTAADLAKQYAGDPRVAAYREVLPNIVGAMNAPDNAQGDLSIIYAFAKTMDPGSAVRGEEMTMAQGSSPLVARLQSYIGSVNQGKRLPPATRRELVNTMRSKGHEFDLAYSEARKQYLGIAKQANLDPDLIVGPHDGAKYQQSEADFKGAPVVNLDGGAGAQPNPDRWRTVTDDEIRDFIIENQGMALPAMAEYAKFKLGRSIDNLPQVMADLKATGKLSDLPVNRTEAGNAQLMGLLEGGKQAWDRAAQGLQGGVNFLTGSDFQSADRAAAESDQFFKSQPVDPTFRDIGRIGGATALTWPIRGPMAAGSLGAMLTGDAKDPVGIGVEGVGGAVGGKIGHALLNGAAQMIAPKLEQPVVNLVREGAQLSPGRIFPGLKKAEDLARSYPMVGSQIDKAMEATAQTVNRIPPNRALGHIGQSLPENVPAGHAAVGYTQKTLGDAYDSNLSGMSVGLDPTFMTRLSWLGQKGGLRPQELKTLNDIVEHEVGGTFSNGVGRMTLRDFKRLDSRLGSISSKLQASPDDPFKVQLGESVGFVKDQLGGLLRRQLPDRANNLRALDKAWADFVPYQRAAAMEMADGIASPGQFASAVRQSDRSLRKGATAKGEARMQDFAMDTAKVLPATRGNSGTTDRANLMSPTAWTLGTLLSPLYSNPALATINKLAARDAGPFAQISADALRALPPGISGAMIPYWINSGQ